MEFLSFPSRPSVFSTTNRKTPDAAAAAVTTRFLYNLFDRTRRRRNISRLGVYVRNAQPPDTLLARRTKKHYYRAVGDAVQTSPPPYNIKENPSRAAENTISLYPSRYFSRIKYFFNPIRARPCPLPYPRRTLERADSAHTVPSKTITALLILLHTLHTHTHTHT